MSASESNQGQNPIPTTESATDTQTPTPTAAPAPAVAAGAIQRVPSYSAEELASRIHDGSIDLNRLAATTLKILQTEDAIVKYINSQIQKEQEATGAKKGR